MTTLLFWDGMVALRRAVLFALRALGILGVRYLFSRIQQRTADATVQEVQAGVREMHPVGQA